MPRLILVALLLALPLAQARADAADSERDALRESLRTSCRDFASEAQWAEADACRRAWFTAHEEAIWRLDLNPHRATPQPPPS